MESEITFLVTYRCSRCRALLSSGPEEWSSWLRCPKCGRAGLPPDYTAPPPSSYVKFDAKEDVLVITDDGSSTIMSAALPPVHRRSALYGGSRRLLLVTGFFISLLILLFAVLEQNSVNAAASGFAALACLGFLLIPTRR